MTPHQRCFSLAALSGALIFSLLGGCGNTPTPSDTASNAALTKAATPKAVARATFPRDDLGREIDLKAPAKRIVSLGPGATEMLFFIGAGKQLVGRDDASDFPREAKKLPVAGDYKGPNLEASVALRPDLVVIQGESYNAARADEWQRKIGVPVAVLGAVSVRGVADDARKLGAWTDRQVSANALAAKIRASQAKTLQAKAKAQPSAFIDLGRDPIYTAGRGTLISDALRSAGLRNATSVTGYQKFNSEALLALKPDFYVAGYEGGVENAKLAQREVEKIRRHDVIGRLTCVREGRVIVVPSDWLLRPGPRLVQGIAAIQREAK